MSETRNLDELIEQVSTCIAAAYNKGYEAAKQYIVAVGNKSEYERGLLDAEKAIRRLVVSIVDGGLSAEEMRMIFGISQDYAILTNFSMSEIVEKIREYDEEKVERNISLNNELHIGDEVYILDKNNKAVVTSLLDNGRKVNILCTSGNYLVVETQKLHKTGRLYSIEDILKELSEEHDD